MVSATVTAAESMQPPQQNSKPEKQAPAEVQDPLKQAIKVLEHKIRNLEKRKGKLDIYKESGKPLTKDQQEAVNKYEEVLQQLELSKEYVKQFTSISVEADKNRKRAAKREAMERINSDLAKIRQVLIIQEVLQNMGTDQTREDFLAGRNGALQLTEADLQRMDDLYTELSPKREGDVPFMTQVQRAAEHFLGIIEGKSRELVGTPCSQLQTLITSISTCAYFDQPRGSEPLPQEEEATEEPEPIPQTDAPEPQEPVESVNIPQEGQLPPMIPPPVNLPPNPNLMRPMIPQNIVPVSQVESNIFNAQGFKPPQVAGPQPPAGAQPPIIAGPPSAALNEVMSATTLSFFQESELDWADFNKPGKLPSKTYTNQRLAQSGVFSQPPAQPTAQQQPPPQTTPYYVANVTNYTAGAPAPPPAAIYPPEMIPGFTTQAVQQQPPPPPAPQTAPPAASNPQQPPIYVPVPQQQPPQQQSAPPSSHPPATEPPAGKGEQREDWSSTEKLDWSQDPSNEWESNEWTGATADGQVSNGGSNKFGGSRSNNANQNYRPRNQNGYQNNRNRVNNYQNNRQGYRDNNRERDSTANNHGSYYQNGYGGYGKSGGEGGYRKGPQHNNNNNGGPRGPPRNDRRDYNGSGGRVNQQRSGPRPQQRQESVRVK